MSSQYAGQKAQCRHPSSIQISFHTCFPREKGDRAFDTAAKYIIKETISELCYGRDNGKPMVAGKCLDAC